MDGSEIQWDDPIPPISISGLPCQWNNLLWRNPHSRTVGHLRHTFMGGRLKGLLGHHCLNKWSLLNFDINEPTLMLRHVQHQYIQMWLVPVVLFVGSQFVFSSGALLRADAKPLSLKMVGADSLEGSMDGCFHRSSKGRGRLPSNLEKCCFLSVTPLVFSPSKLLTVYIVLFTCENNSGMETMIQYVNICQSMPEASWNIHPNPSHPTLVSTSRFLPANSQGI